jgi:hypothetical protein
MENKQKLITFGGESYPKYNNAVLVLGGEGTDKKTVINETINIEGEVFNFEKVVEDAMRSEKFKDRLKKNWDIDLDKLDQFKLKDKTKLYETVERLFTGNDDSPSIWKLVHESDAERKPNIIIQDTIEDSIDFYNQTFSLNKMKKYDKKDIHALWVLEDYDDLRKRNLDGIDGRIISDVNLKVTHDGIAKLMKEILMGINKHEFMDGDVWLVLGKDNVVQVKKSGSQIDRDQVTDELMKLIEERIPKHHFLKL